MPSDSRRRVLAGLAAVLAGCAGTETPTAERTAPPTTTRTDATTAPPPDPPTDSPTDSETDPPTDSDTDSPTDTSEPPLVEPISPDNSAVEWAVECTRELHRAPGVSADGRHVALVFGEVGTQTPSGDGPHGALAMLDGDAGTLRWAIDTERPPTDAPVFVDGDLHTLTGFSNGFYGIDQRVTAYTTAGERLWQSDPVGKFLSVSNVADGRLYVATSDDLTGIVTETLYAFGPEGTVEWTQSIGDYAQSRIVGDTILVSGIGTGVAALDRHTGTERWRLAADNVGPDSEPISVTDGLCLLHPFPDGTMTETDDGDGDGKRDSATNPGLLVAYAVTDGTEQWRYDPPEFDEDARPTNLVTTPGETGADETAVVFALDDGTVIGLGRDGTERWRKSFHGGDTPSLAGGDPVFVGVDTDGAYALDPTDGTRIWRRDHAGFVGVSPLGDGVLVYASDGDAATLTAYDRDGTERWAFGPVALGTVTNTDERVYVTTETDRLYTL